MKYFVTVAGRTVEVDLGSEQTTVDGTPVEADLGHVEGTDLRSLLADGSSWRMVAHRLADGAWDLHLRGRRIRAEAIDERTRAIREMTGTGAGPAGPAPIDAPMPGLVVKVEVAEGDRVEAGQGVVIVEAMKMENELRAPGPGIVERIWVAAGDTVERGQTLVDFSPVEDAVEGDE